MSIIKTFDRIAIIHLPERKDRLKSTCAELARVGISLESDKVVLWKPERFEEADGFASRHVRSNFLSHLGVLSQAQTDGVDSILVLEDDAIFHNVLRGDALVASLRSMSWDMCYLGHTLSTAGLGTGLIKYQVSYGPFIHAHCYAVHRGCLPRLTGYLRTTLENPPGHPQGGKVYIDGAYNMFRSMNPDVVTLIASPNLVRQKGCPSSIAGAKWYDKAGILRGGLQIARGARDGVWRRMPRGVK